MARPAGKFPSMAPGWIGCPVPMRTLRGKPDPAGRRFAVVASRFNDAVTDRLLAGCVDRFREAGVEDDDLLVVSVPGAFEIPLTAGALASSGEFDAVVALGAVIRGETDHYDHICREVAAGISAVSLETGVPCIFGVLTTETEEQALDRCGGAHGHKGRDAADTAMEMADLMERLPAPDGAGS